MTKTVADAAMLLQAIAGHDPLDPSTTQDPVPDYTKALTGNVKGVRIGVPTNYFFDNVDARAQWRACGRRLRRSRKWARRWWTSRCRTRSLPDRPAGSLPWRKRRASTSSGSRTSPILFDPIVRERLDAARFYPATDYIKSLRVRSMLMDSMQRALAKCDVLAVPAGNPANKLEPPEVAWNRCEARLEVDAHPPWKHVHWQHDRAARDCHSLWFHHRSAATAIWHSVLRQTVRRSHAVPCQRRL